MSKIKQKYLRIRQKISSLSSKLMMYKKVVILVLVLTLSSFLVLNSTLKFKLKAEKIDTSYEKIQVGKEIILDFNQIGDKYIHNIGINENGIGIAIDLATTNVIVKNYQTQTTFETLAVDNTLSNTSQNKQKSPLTLTYILEGNSTEYFLDGYEHAIKHKKYKIEEIPNGVKVTYYVSMYTPSHSWMPQVISESLFQEISSIANEQEKRAIEVSYEFNIGTNAYKIRPTVSQSNIDLLYKVWYEKYHLSFDDLFEMNKYYGVTNAFINKPEFHIPVLYYLDGDDLIVRLESNDIVENSIILEDGKTLQLTKVDLLPYFGSTKVKADAFMFVPDGSGAIIDLSQNGDVFNNYQKALYDSDALLSSNYESYTTDYPITLPVFGISAGKNAIFGIVEHGAQQGTLKLTRASQTNDLSNINTQITYRYVDAYTITSNVTVDTFSPFLNNDYYQIRYKLFESTDKINYMDFVKMYQSYLFKNRQREEIDVDLVVEMIGAYEDTAFFMGIPYDKVYALTTYEQASSIMNDFNGKANVNFNYVGFQKSGIHGQSALNFKLESALGSKKDFVNLINEANEHSHQFVFSMNFATVYGGEPSFSKSANSVRFIGDYTRAFYHYDLSLNEMVKKSNKSAYYLVNPVYTSSLVDRFISKNKFDIEYLGIQDLASTYLATYSNNQYVPSHFEKSIIESLSKLKNESKIVLNNPFAFAIPYADYLYNLPTQSSGYHIFSYDIPFMQLVLNGYVGYSQPAVNIDNNKSYTYNFLKMIETGSGLKYIITYQNSFLTKSTESFNYLYSTNYQDYKDLLFENQAKIETFNQSIDGYITDHQIIGDLVKVQYSSQVTVYINYSKNPMTYNGITIPALDYLVVS